VQFPFLDPTLLHLVFLVLRSGTIDMHLLALDALREARREARVTGALAICSQFERLIRIVEETAPVVERETADA
jgi:hypothetical protein